jgi:hypothetical protein
MVEFQPFGPKLPHDPEGTLEHERDVREEAERAHDVKRASETAHPSSLGYAIVLLGPRFSWPRASCRTTGTSSPRVGRCRCTTR